jgi:peptide deformylase
MKFRIIPNQQTPKVELIKNIDTFLKDNFNMLEKYLSFAKRQHNCVGLAANQVSLKNERIMYKFFAIKEKHFWDIKINPEIIKYKGKAEEKIEGCLTWLGKKLSVKRYKEIEVKYFNLKGEYIKEIITGNEAQVWQHEIDHLNGVEERFI